MGGGGSSKSGTGSRDGVTTMFPKPPVTPEVQLVRPVVQEVALSTVVVVPTRLRKVVNAVRLLLTYTIKQVYHRS